MSKPQDLTMLDAIIGMPIVGIVIALALLVDMATGSKRLDEFMKEIKL